MTKITSEDRAIARQIEEDLAEKEWWDLELLSDEPNNGFKKISDCLEPIEEVDEDLKPNDRGPRVHKIPKPGEKVEFCPKCGSEKLGLDRVWIGGRGYKTGIFCHNPNCKELTVLWD